MLSLSLSGNLTEYFMIYVMKGLRLLSQILAVTSISKQTLKVSYGYHSLNVYLAISL